MKRVVCLAALAACRYDPPSGPPEVDAPVDPSCTSFASFFDTCALPPGDTVQLAGNLTFDTNSGELRDGETIIDVDTRTITTPAGELEAILVGDLEVADATVIRATGARAFGIVASGSIRFLGGGLIDVSAGGAGARGNCDALPGADRDGGAGGGGGGGFGGAGGTGGGGDSNATTPSVGGPGGAAVALPQGPLGGCPGAKGGDDNNDVGGDPGRAGGAVYLVAADRIEMQTTGIDAAGEGGRGGGQHGLFNGDAGGGGGGSGGMIILEAPNVTSAGALAANGGGGGEGSGGQQDGNAGQRGNLGTSRAIGGNGSSGSGSDGGDGGAKLDPAGGSPTEVLDGAGGGGGGGAGFIIIKAAVQAVALASPAPS